MPGFFITLLNKHMAKRASQYIQFDLPVSALHNPEKYTGRNRILQIKSSWEASFLKFLDSNPSVLGFHYEEVPLQYQSPIDKRDHRYWVDFWLRYYSIDKKIKESLIEIKPAWEAQAALTGKVEFKSQVSEKEQREVLETAAINRAKFQSAMEYCKRNNMKFVIITEYDLILSGSKKFKPNL